MVNDLRGGDVDGESTGCAVRFWGNLANVWATGDTHVSRDKMPSRKNWVRVAVKSDYLMLVELILWSELMTLLSLGGVVTVK
jgi:hypothetical protein